MGSVQLLVAHSREEVIYKGSLAHCCQSSLLATIISMRINRAIGLGIGILVLQMLMSTVFNGFEEVLLALFDTTQTALDVVEEGITFTPASQIANIAPTVR